MMFYERGNWKLLLVKRSKEYHENAIYMDFQFNNPKLSQKMWFLFSVSVYYIDSIAKMLADRPDSDVIRNKEW